MLDERIKPIVMPKWGLSMSQGKITNWLKPVGTRLAPGDEILEVETDKIAGVVEAGDTGTLRRLIGEPALTYPVKALLGVIADDDVSDAEIDAYVAGYVTPVADADNDQQAGPQYEFVETPAGTIRYAKRGDGAETIVLVHGFGGDLDNWLFNIDALAGKAKVYALDLPGHGQSTKKLGEPSLAGLSDALTGFMDAVGIDSAHLIGHSMGGAVVLQTAIDEAARVKSLTLVSSAGLGPEINGAYIDGFVTASSRRELKPVLEQLFEEPGLVSRQLVDNVLKYKRLDGVSEALASLARALFANGRQSDGLAVDLAKVQQPMQVIWGANDRIIPSSHAAAPQSARIDVVDGAGHMVQMEKASRVNELILAHVLRGIA
jgi:pyruvate dehydrogenase E2 component (dihydrolipoyllysine-residue acetyltransferase)